MPREFIPHDDIESIVRSKREIEEDGLGATPNEVAEGLANPDQVVEEATTEDAQRGYSGGTVERQKAAEQEAAAEAARIAEERASKD